MEPGDVLGGEQRCVRGLGAPAEFGTLARLKPDRPGVED